MTTNVNGKPSGSHSSGALGVLPAGEPGRTRPSAIPKRICARADELRRDRQGLRPACEAVAGTGVVPIGGPPDL